MHKNVLTFYRYNDKIIRKYSFVKFRNLLKECPVKKISITLIVAAVRVNGSKGLGHSKIKGGKIK